MGKIPQSLLSRHTTSQFKREKVQFVTQFSMGPLDFFSYATNGLIQTQTCFHANHHQVQSIRNSPLKCILPLYNGPSEPEHWSIIATCGCQHIEKCQFGSSGKSQKLCWDQCKHTHDHHGQEELGTKEKDRCLPAPIARGDQFAPSGSNILNVGGLI